MSLKLCAFRTQNGIFVLFPAEKRYMAKGNFCFQNTRTQRKGRKLSGAARCAIDAGIKALSLTRALNSNRTMEVAGKRLGAKQNILLELEPGLFLASIAQKSSIVWYFRGVIRRSPLN